MATISGWRNAEEGATTYFPSTPKVCSAARRSGYPWHYPQYTEAWCGLLSAWQPTPARCARARWTG